MGLLLLMFLARPAQAQVIPLPQTGSPGQPSVAQVAVCLDGSAPEVLAEPMLPVEVRVSEQLAGVLIVKQVGQQILVRAEDLRESGLALPLTCTAGQYLALPGDLDAQLDTTTLVLRLGPKALKVQASAPDAPTPDTPQTTGTLLSAGASVVAAGDQVTGTLSTETDTRLLIRPEPANGEVQVFGLRSSGSFGVHLADGQGLTQGSVAGTYLYWQKGVLEADLGLIPAGVQSDLGTQQGSPLLGASLRRASAADAGAPLRLDSAVGGSYRVFFRGVVLRQGALQPGVTLVSDLLYPPVQDELTIELSDASGALLRRYTVPFDRRPQARPVGTLDYTLDAGLRDRRPSAGLSGTLSVTPDGSVQAGILLGADWGLHAGLQLNGPALTLNGDASLLSTTETDQGDTRLGRVSLGLSRTQDWGSWVVRGSAETARETSGAGAEVGRSTLLGLQAALFLTRPALQLQGKVEQLSSVSGGSVLGGTGVLTSTLRGDLSVAGSLHLERPPRSPDGASASSTDADWSVRVYASQTRQEGNGAAPVRQAGVSVGLNLKMLDGRPDLVVQTGVQDGLPLLAVQRTAQQDDLSVQGTVRVLPTPAVGVSVSGPYTASLDVASGPVPVLAAALSGSLVWAGAGRPPQPVAGGTRQVLLVKVGVPGVQVRSSGVLATTDASGRATLPLYAGLRQSEVDVVFGSLPLSTSFSVLTLTVQPAPGALITVADFTPYLLRTNLRQLPGTVPLGAVARLGDESFTVAESRYVQLDARNGDRIAVSWPTGNCTAVWSDQEVLDCQNDP